MSATLLALDTPAALIDMARMHRNIVRMQLHIDSLEVRLRPPRENQQMSSGSACADSRRRCRGHGLHPEGGRVLRRRRAVRRCNDTGKVAPYTVSRCSATVQPQNTAIR